MTSNLGATYLIDNTLTDKEKEVAVEKALKQTFRPEFINRIDDIVIFDNLTKSNIEKILSITINDIEKRLKDKHLHLELTDLAKDWLINNGYDYEFGARPLKRLIKRELENKLAYAILEGKINDFDHLIIDVDKDNLSISVK